MLTPPLPWDQPTQQEGDGTLVILLHGLWRSHRAMEPLARRLQAFGYPTLNVPYPSARLSIGSLCQRLAPSIADASKGRETYWITHSLGGIIARSLLENEDLRPTKLVMLAPPNQGSEIVDKISKIPLLGTCLGPAGRELGSGGSPARLPAPPDSVETMVIMGNKSTIPLFRKMLDPENDGIVSVGKGALPSRHHFHVIDADHTFIQVHPETVRLCLDFFRSAM